MWKCTRLIEGLTTKTILTHITTGFAGTDSAHLVHTHLALDSLKPASTARAVYLATRQPTRQIFRTSVILRLVHTTQHDFVLDLSRGAENEGVIDIRAFTASRQVCTRYKGSKRQPPLHRSITITHRYPSATLGLTSSQCGIESSELSRRAVKAADQVILTVPSRYGFLVEAAHGSLVTARR